MTEPNDIIEEIEVPASEESFEQGDSYIDEPETEVESSVDDDQYITYEANDADELWDKLDLTALTTDPNDFISEEPDDAEAEAAFPSEEDDVDAEYAEYEATEEDTENDFAEFDEADELDDEEVLGYDLERPAPLSRRKAERVVKGVIEPFRDPSTPIEEVLNSLSEFHPTRTQQLAEVVVRQSVQAYPDQWLQSITGLDVTVDQVREWAEQGGSSPSNTASTPAEYSTSNAAAEHLSNIYGEDWMNPANDVYLLAEDQVLAQAARDQMSKDAAYQQLQQELNLTRSQLNELQPQIDDIKTAQEAELEQAFVHSYTSQVDEYRESVEGDALPYVFALNDLAPKESDTAEVVAVKELLASRFQPIEGYGSDFDIFLEKQFSGRESMTKAMQRVANYLLESTKLETQAKRISSAVEANQLKVKAEGLKNQAYNERDALTVWTRKAAAEFLESPRVYPIVELLQQNADLKRRVNSSGRPEIVGQTTALGGYTFQDHIKEAKEQGVNPFDVDISSILGGR
jgi:hypothetical protein